MWCLSHSPWKFSNLTSLSYNHRLGLFLLMHFAFSPQCSSGPHSPILSCHHYSNNHLLDFSLMVTASKVRTEYWCLAALGMCPQNAPPHFREATRQPELIFQVSLGPHVVYFASISLGQICGIHALQWTPNANLSPFSSPVLAKRGSHL